MRAACQHSVARWAGRLFRLSVWASVCALLFPLPVGLQIQDFFPAAAIFSDADAESPDKSEGPAFPCQNRPCGCRSATQCWKKCCCFTNKQKIAWAKEHGVDVPDFVVAAAEKEACTTAAKSKSCCTHKNSGSGEAPKAPRSKTVIALMAHECQGLFWLMTGVPVAVEPLVPKSGCAEDSIAYTLTIQSERLPEVPAESMLIPPRIG